MTDDTAPAQLKALRKRAGLSMAKVAKALQFANASSYQRYEDPALFTKTHLPLSVVRPLLDILVGLGRPPIARQEVLMLGGLQDLTLPQLNALDAHNWIWCVGEAAAGTWREAFEWGEDDRLPVALAIRDDRYPGIKRSAVRVVGDSMDLLYPDQSFVVFVRFGDIGRGPKHGDRVVVLQHRQGLTEATIKEYTKDTKGKRWLVPRSTNPAHSALSIDQIDDGETIDVVGLIVGSQKIE